MGFIVQTCIQVCPPPERIQQDTPEGSGLRTPPSVRTPRAPVQNQVFELYMEIILSFSKMCTLNPFLKFAFSGHQKTSSVNEWPVHKVR